METFFQNPREEWTELEKRAFEEVQNICNRHDGDAEAKYGAWEAMVWLSSQLPIKSNWKPSEEQMKGLKFFLDFHRPQRNAGTTNWREYDTVESLYEQLKKL